MEFRALKGSDLEAYGELNRYCFRDLDTIEHRDRYMAIVSEHLAHTWGAFDRGVLHAGLWYNLFDMQVGGAFLPMGGVAAVVSRPETRSRGLVRELMTRMHQQMRAEKCALSVLMPFKNIFYGRMGYADTFFVHEHQFDPQLIAGRPVGSYALREIHGAAHWQLLERLRLRCSAQYYGTVRRDAKYWRIRYTETWKGIRNVYLVERRLPGKKRDVHVAGYLITNLFPTPERADLRIVQAIWEDPGALTAIFQFLRGLRDQVKEVRWFLPTDVDLFGYFEDPRIKVTLWPKMMSKLVDLKAAIEGRHYAPDCTGEVILDVTGDETSPWNTGKWKMTWEDGTAVVRKIQRPSGKTPVVRLDIQTLAVIYSGHRTASALVREGFLHASANATQVLDRAFPKGVPNMEEWF